MYEAFLKIYGKGAVICYDKKEKVNIVNYWNQYDTCLGDSVDFWDNDILSVEYLKRIYLGL